MGSTLTHAGIAVANERFTVQSAGKHMNQPGALSTNKLQAMKILCGPARLDFDHASESAGAKGIGSMVQGERSRSDVAVHPTVRIPPITIGPRLIPQAPPRLIANLRGVRKSSFA